jgi:hypothetical protein
LSLLSVVFLFSTIGNRKPVRRQAEMSGACADDRGEERFGPWRQEFAPAMDADLSRRVCLLRGGDIATTGRRRLKCYYARLTFMHCGVEM